MARKLIYVAEFFFTFLALKLVCIGSYGVFGGGSYNLWKLLSFFIQSLG